MEVKEFDLLESLNKIVEHKGAVGLRLSMEAEFLQNALKLYRESLVDINESDGTAKNGANKISISALDLINTDIEELPKLVEPIFQKVGVCALVGSSDTGKSTILRQLALAITLGRTGWVDFEIKPIHKKAIYVSTEDGRYAVTTSIRKQLEAMKLKEEEKQSLSNLKFIFNAENLIEKLTVELIKEPVDVIIIDAFTDVFTKEINSSVQVREFLNQYSKLAEQFECLIIFLHHTGKRTQKFKPSKDSVLGSQAFEAKMRCLVELKTDMNEPTTKHLCILKSNYLASKLKQSSYELSFDENALFFTNTGNRVPLDFLRGKANNTSKFQDNKTTLLDEALKLNKQGKFIKEY